MALYGNVDPENPAVTCVAVRVRRRMLCLELLGMEQKMIDRILRRPEVEHCTGLSRATLYEEIAGGRFPRPVRIARRAVGWPKSLIDAWLASRPSSCEEGRGT
jgi:prophage regulatory protein